MIIVMCGAEVRGRKPLKLKICFAFRYWWSECLRDVWHTEPVERKSDP